MRSIRHPLRRFAQVDGRRRALVVEAVAYLLLARLALIFISFPNLAKRFGAFMSPADSRAVEARARVSHEQAAAATDIGWAVTRAARYVPFRAVCLPQAMAARLMLKRRGIASVLHFGGGKARDGLGQNTPYEAHAWLDAAGVEVTGYPVTKGFVEIGCFV